MADARATVVVSSLTPDRVSRAEFSNSFRGFDPTEVRGFLARVAGELGALLDREAELMARVAELEQRRPPTIDTLDEHQVTELLGAETARVLDAAREAAVLIRANADQQAAAVLEEARARADELTGQAEQVLGERTAEAEAEAARIRDEAESEARRIRGEAEAVRAEARADASAEVDDARAEGRRMVAEARAVRERILTDMARRRNQTRQQVERLRAGRDRLIDAVNAVRRAVEEASGELNGSLVEAKLAGERAARLVDVDHIPPMNELDAEVELAKDAGLVDAAAIERALHRGEGPPTGEHEAVVVAAADVVDVAEDDPAPIVDEEAAEPPAPPADEGGAESPQLEPAAGAVDASSGESHHEEPVPADVELEVGDDPPEGVGAAMAEVEAEPEAVVVPGGPIESPQLPSWLAGGPDGKTDEVSLADGPAIDAAEPAVSVASVESVAAPDEEGDVGAATSFAEVAAALVAEDEAADDEADSDERGADGPRPVRRKDFGHAVDDLFSRWKTTTPDDESPVADAVVADGDAVGPDEEPAAVGVVEFAVDGPEVAEQADQAGGTLGIESTSNRRLGGVSSKTSSRAAGGSSTTGRGRKSRAAASASAADAAAAAAIQDAANVHTRDAHLAGPSRDLTRQLKLALSDEQNLILELVRGRSGQKGGTAAAPTLPEAAVLAAPYREAAGLQLRVAWEAGWQAVAGNPPTGETDNLGPVVDDLIAGLVASLRERLEAAFADDDRAGLADRVRNLYRETRNQRVAPLVDHAGLVAFARGQVAALRGEGRVRWVFDACSPDCFDNSLAGEVPIGTSFPTGQTHPPGFVGCRCLLVVASGAPGVASDDGTPTAP